jgi:hypothetical protein
MMKNALIVLLLICSLAAAAAQDGLLDHLPANIEVLTHFGERADIAPDNRAIAFMAKSFGDAFTIDLDTRAIRCLTCSNPGAAFLRVMHLVSGDYILIGPERFRDVARSRWADSELWFLSRTPGSRPVRLGQMLHEGAAISKRSLKIAYGETRAQARDLGRGASRLVVADIELSGATARIVNRRVVFRSADGGCVIEAQDFYANDSKLTFTCYQPKDAASVMSVDLASGAVTEMSQAPGTYNESEGIYPDGLHTNVESDRQARSSGRPGGWGQLDIWKLRLDGTGKDFTRLTHFNDYPGWKASNPVVSTDGSFMAFQAGRSGDEAGVGYGILIYRF